MANKPQAAAAKQEVAVAPQQAVVSAELLKQMEADAGKGISENPNDVITPYVYVLQSGSPQVKKGDPERIEGAEEGDFLLRGATTLLVKGEEGLLFQQSGYMMYWGEWKPERGGFVANHPIDVKKPAEESLPEGYKVVANPKNPKFPNYKSAQGNDLSLTRAHVGNVYNMDPPQPFILTFTSTGHIVSKTWTSMQRSRRLPNGGVPPAFAAFYRLKTKRHENADGAWFLPTVEDAGPVTKPEDYARGKQLAEMFNTGMVKAETPTPQPGAGAAADDEIPF